MQVFGLQQKIETRGESVCHLLEQAPLGGHCPGSDLSVALILPAASEQWPLNGPDTQLWAEAFWLSAEDAFLLPTPELAQVLPASGPLPTLFSFAKEALLCQSMARPTLTPYQASPHSRTACTPPLHCKLASFLISVPPLVPEPQEGQGCILLFTSVFSEQNIS